MGPRPLLLRLWEVRDGLSQEPPVASLRSTRQPGLQVVVEKVLVPGRPGVGGLHALVRYHLFTAQRRPRNHILGGRSGAGLVQEPEPEEGTSEQCDPRVCVLPTWPAPPAAGPLNPALLWSNGRASCQPFLWLDMLSASFHPCGLVGMRM